MASLVVLLVAAFLAVAVLAVVLSYLAAKKRREAMRAFASSRGWRFEEQQPLLVDRFAGAPFGLGFGRRAFNAVYGSHEGREFVSFDYEYKTQTTNGKQTRTVNHRYSVLALNLGAPAPALSVDPEGFFDRVVDAFTDSEIELESEDFNRTFSVTCPDRRFASDVLHPQMMEYLLLHPWMGWRFERDSLLVVQKGQRQTAQIDGTLAFMDGLTDRIPEFVWLRLRGQG